MITQKELTSYLSDFLNCAAYNDYAPNGLQLEGSDSIGRICTAVTASEAVISQARDWEADALLVHHGYFWKGENPAIVGIKHRRIRTLLENNINLFAYHLPLDCHMDLGNNACLSKRLPLSEWSTHTINNVANILWSGTLSKPVNALEFNGILEKIFNRTPIHITSKNQSIRSIAWCTGAAQDFIEEAAALGVDAYLSGEISERTYYQAKELNIHYYSCGHHATERFGIKALGEHLEDCFKLEHIFIDSDNPV